MNKTITELKRHRSIRRFTEQPIADDVFAELVAAGQAASTSSFIQAVSIVKVEQASARSAFVELTGGQKYIENAAEFLVFCADLSRNAHRVAVAEEGASADFSWTEQFLSATVDVALFAQNLVVAAESVGLGCCYIGGIRNDPSKVTAMLDLPELVYPVFGLCLGYPDQDPDIKPRLPASVVVHRDRYYSAEELRDTIDSYDSHVRKYYIQRTDGKLDLTWSEQMRKQAQTQARPFMLEYLHSQGFMKK